MNTPISIMKTPIPSKIHPMISLRSIPYQRLILIDFGLLNIDKSSSARSDNVTSSSKELSSDIMFMIMLIPLKANLDKLEEKLWKRERST